MIPVPAASQTVTITLASELAELSRLVATVNEFCRRSAAPSADTSALHLALEEIVTNVITHGYHGDPTQSLTVTLEAPATDRIRAVVTDNAAAYNPLARPGVNTALPLEQRPVGGLGVHLVRRLMDVCHYERRDGRNLFTIERRFGRVSGAPAATSISISKLESSGVIAPAGSLDGLSSPELERQVGALIRSGLRTLVFDLSGLDYVSSAGLRVFIVAAKQLKATGGGAQFTALTPEVRNVFHISGLLTALDVRDGSHPE